MSRYKDSNKYKIYGEDAILAARFDKYLDATLRNCRADYLKALSKRKQRGIPYGDLPDAEKETVQESSAADDEIESLLFWEALKTHLHLLTPKECETMICLYIKRLSVKETALKNAMLRQVGGQTMSPLHMSHYILTRRLWHTVRRKT